MEILALGEKIKRKRKELNLTLKDLAGDRITPGQISLVESGKSNPSMDLLEYLAASLNTSVEYLMESEESQAEKICLYYENIAEAYVLNGDCFNAEKYIEKAIYFSEKYNLEYRKAKTLYLRGKVHLEKKEYTLSQQYFLSANVLFIKNNNFEDIVQAFKNLGVITLQLKAYHSANSYFQQAEEVYTSNELGNDFTLGEIYYFRSYTYFKLDDMKKAIDYAFLAQEKFRYLDNKKEYAKSLLLISEQLRKEGSITKAIKYSQKTLEAFKEIDDLYYVSIIENNLGKLFYEFENIEQSFKHFEKAKEIRIKNKDANLIETLINICENYIKLKESEPAKKVLEEIMSEVEYGNDKALINYYLLKYKIDLLDGKNLEAENTLLMALNFAKNMEYFKEAGEIAISLGRYYIDIGADEKAARYLNEGVNTFKELGIIGEL